ncbi:general secretion pathway protein GspK [Oxalobacteraceae bacterium OM1]|nr:general secretion pathway protein GspK [Oxalobacteraceae bacterium OM1]
MRRRLPFARKQRGVAVVTALLLTTLAITIVASLFWQQQVQVRSIENQRLQLQKQWILRGALDWTRLILREDARHSTVDHLGEPWAVPLAETRLDEYVEKGSNDSDASDAALSGGITDAQARFNLTNLCPNGKIEPNEVKAFAKLLTNARQNPELALQTANLMASAQPRLGAVAQQPLQSPGSAAPGGTPAPTATTTATGSSENQPLTLLTVDDLLAVPGFTPEALAAIRDFVIVLPRPTPMNVNTAPAEVLSARIDTLSLSDAAALVAARERAWFKDTGDFNSRLTAMGKTSPTAALPISVSTNYFLVLGNVRLNRAGMLMQALIERNGLSTKVVWIRQS